MRTHWTSGLCALAMMAMGCSPSPTVTLDVPPASDGVLLDQLAGSWVIEATTWSDCPSEWQRPMPTGQTTWSIEGDHLVIQDRTNATPPAELWPADASTLVRQMQVSFMGCSATEALTLVIDEEANGWATGLYSAHITHDGSAACESMAADAGLPESCETVVQWRGRRLGGR